MSGFHSGRAASPTAANGQFKTKNERLFPSSDEEHPAGNQKQMGILMPGSSKLPVTAWLPVTAGLTSALKVVPLWAER